MSVYAHAPIQITRTNYPIPPVGGREVASYANLFPLSQFHVNPKRLFQRLDGTYEFVTEEPMRLASVSFGIERGVTIQLRRDGTVAYWDYRLFSSGEVILGRTLRTWPHNPPRWSFDFCEQVQVALRLWRREIAPRHLPGQDRNLVELVAQAIWETRWDEEWLVLFFLPRGTGEEKQQIIDLSPRCKRIKVSKE